MRDNRNDFTPQPLVLIYEGEIYGHRKTRPNPQGTCPLCGDYKPIIRSHINPNWAWIAPKWLNGGEKKIQAGQWFYLLCGSCDGMLGEYEAKLRAASYLQPKDFQSPMLFREISIALIGILWKSSVANRFWTENPDVLPSEEEYRILDILKTLKKDREKGLRLVADTYHWSGTKMFSKTINPFSIQTIPSMQKNLNCIGFVVLAGIRWVIKEKGERILMSAHVFNENEGQSFEDLLFNLDSEASEKMKKLAEMTAENDPCPCGNMKRTGLGEDVERKLFTDCCKKGWLSEPYTPVYYIDYRSK